MKQPISALYSIDFLNPDFDMDLSKMPNNAAWISP